MRTNPAIACLLLVAAAAAAGQDDPSGSPPPIERLQTWPVFEGTALAQVKRDIQRLRKARTDEMGAEAEQALLEAGAGVVPLLLPSLGHEQDPAARQRIEAVLEALSSAAHTRLLGEHFADDAQGVRTWCLRRCAQFPDPGLLEPAEAAWEAVTKRGERADPEELYAAALCAASAGSWASFEQVKQAALDSWGKRGAEIRSSVGALRGPQGVERTADFLKSGDRKRIVAGLNLLSGCGDEQATFKVRPFLSNNDNSIRVAAINALRGIVDRAPPVENLPVFDAIEMANEWKQRLK